MSTILQDYVVWNEADQVVEEFESTVYILTFGSKPVGVYSTNELALDARDQFIEIVDKHHDKTWIDIMFYVIPMQLDMPVDITRIRPN
jgi:hypothetical protein